MTIVASGAISINSLVGEYGGSAPHAMNEYYRGGSLVSDHSNNANVPTSGTIDLQDFYGANNTSPSDLVCVITPAQASGKFPFHGYDSAGTGSASDTTLIVGGTTYTMNHIDTNTSIAFSSKLTFGTSQPAISHITISSSGGTSAATALTWESAGSYFTFPDGTNVSFDGHVGNSTTLTFTAS